MPEGPSVRGLALSGILAGFVAAVVILISSGGKIDQMTFGDGVLHRAVASHLTADRTSVPRLIASSGSAIRYGRIGFPVVLWLTSAGNEAAMRFVQPFLMVMCAAAIGIATRALFASGSVVLTLAPFVSVGLLASIAGGFAEPLAIGFAVWAVVMIERDHAITSAALLAVAMLTRENVLTVAAGLIVWEMLKSRRRAALFLACSILPVAAWHVVVMFRFGHLPLLDPWLRTTRTIDTPLLGTLRTLTGLGPSAVFVVALHLVCVAVALPLWRRSSMATAAAASGLALLSVGSTTWGYIGDAVRVASLFEVMFILAALNMWWTRNGRSKLPEWS